MEACYNHNTSCIKLGRFIDKNKEKSKLYYEGRLKEALDIHQDSEAEEWEKTRRPFHILQIRYEYIQATRKMSEHYKKALEDFVRTYDGVFNDKVVIPDESQESDLWEIYNQ
ncbi:hypothetical protein RF11_00101 [Thelohanellus kitauei]|uniref:Uncharacterized protein n=1 Tax=Thelohanellus kitauei TaxID=669202 RepID=A0A0C2JVQ9_THEKT|nr:hypothetical protein RF11_00101 [Thelohanellus kitauei]